VNFINSNNETASGDLDAVDPEELTPAGELQQPVIDASDSDVEETVATTKSSGGGALSWRMLITLLLLASACVHGRHKRQVVAVRHLS